MELIVNGRRVVVKKFRKNVQIISLIIVSAIEIYFILGLGGILNVPETHRKWLFSGVLITWGFNVILRFIPDHKN